MTYAIVAAIQRATLRERRQLLRWLEANLSYNPHTGMMHWKVPGRRRPRHKRAGNLNNREGRVYLHCGRWGRQLRSRVAYLIVWGHWPTPMCHHVNGVTSDDRIANLQEVTCRVNQQHRRDQARYVGVVHTRQRYDASIKVDGKKRHIGSYDTPQKAHTAYLAAIAELGERPPGANPLATALTLSRGDHRKRLGLTELEYIELFGIAELP